MRNLTAILFIIPLILSGQQTDYEIKKDIKQITFGSCSKEYRTDEQLWQEINQVNPDLWIWLGDNIYGDTEDMQVMRTKYDLQKSHPEYQKLIANSEVIGIWDDHDFGVNDGGSEYPKKDESKHELFRFLDIDQQHPARKRKGAYQSYTFTGAQGNIKIILLDARYFRDSLKWANPGTKDKIALVNKSGDILGNQQWKWLEAQLSDPNIDFFILGSGIQVIADAHRWEKWSNFPEAKSRLYELIQEEVKVPLVFISGDRHLSEVSMLNLENHPYSLWDLTSSSLNSPSSMTEELNTYRVGDMIPQANFALMSIEWDNRVPNLSLVYQGKDGKVFQEIEISFEKGD